jgi:hypothetical protein
MYFGTYQISEKVSWHTEMQWRRNNWITDVQQLLLRTGMNYHLNNNAIITAGYCFVQTYPYGNFPVKKRFSREPLMAATSGETNDWKI